MYFPLDVFLIIVILLCEFKLNIDIFCDGIAVVLDFCLLYIRHSLFLLVFHSYIDSFPQSLFHINAQENQTLSRL